MIKIFLAAAVAAVLSTPAFAQYHDVPASTGGVGPRGVPDVVTRQPGSTGEEGAVTHSPTGSAEDGISDDSAASGNEGQPSRLGSTGSGGGR
ncbi:hypothetical protein FV232_28110 [Methylobacterium sp. WL30]|nr:hypothetical protein FV225_11955 [Methylobacterium sp. WL93]TXN60471.1 hypothetical protein FV232_28110 [Methylobacterium sp. WL30]